MIRNYLEISRAIPCEVKDEIHRLAKSLSRMEPPKQDVERAFQIHAQYINPDSDEDINCPACRANVYKHIRNVQAYLKVVDK